jgi:dihydrodipicolinate synthase/N-acetylneuraminate lyase
MNLSGIYPPVATPFKDDQVDVTGLAHNVQRWMTTGLRGLLVEA